MNTHCKCGSEFGSFAGVQRGLEGMEPLNLWTCSNPSCRTTIPGPDPVQLLRAYNAAQSLVAVIQGIADGSLPPTVPSRGATSERTSFEGART